MKFNFRWGKNNKQEITPEITEQKVNVYEHPNPIKGAEHLGERQCKICGRWFKPNAPVQVMCSHECRLEAERQYQRRHYQELKAKREGKTNEQRKEEKVVYGEPIIRASGRKWTPRIKTCPVCGKTFAVTNNKQIYCCREHLIKANNNFNGYRKDKTEGKKNDLYVKTCAICGKEFTAKRDEAKYCSDKCRKEAMRRTAHKYWVEKGAAKRGYKPVEAKPVLDFWHTQASVIAKLVETGVDEDVIAKYLETVFVEK